ncbi:hypothetical protein EGX20_00885 [Enterococcus faecium]|nr:hypothetical protein EGX20_00885 [Enterococcus faecium]
MILYFIFLIYIYLSFFNEVLMNKLFNNQYNLGENKNFFRIGAMALTILFLGLRYENGWDYMQYYYTCFFYTTHLADDMHYLALSTHLIVTYKH